MFVEFTYNFFRRHHPVSLITLCLSIPCGVACSRDAAHIKHMLRGFADTFAKPVLALNRTADYRGFRAVLRVSRKRFNRVMLVRVDTKVARDGQRFLYDVGGAKISV